VARTARSILGIRASQDLAPVVIAVLVLPSPLTTLRLRECAVLDCKTVGFFLKISKEIGKAWRKSLTREKRASLTRP